MIKGIWSKRFLLLLSISLVSCTTINTEVISNSKAYVNDDEELISYQIDHPKINVTDGLIVVKPRVVITQQAYVDYVTLESEFIKHPTAGDHVAAVTIVPLMQYIMAPAMLVVAMVKPGKAWDFYTTFYGCDNDDEAFGLNRLNQVDCTMNENKYDETKKVSPRVTAVNNWLHNIKIFVSSDNNDGFFIPVNKEGYATTSLQELGNPDEFEVKITYNNDDESFDYDVDARYVDSNALARQGQFKITSSDEVFSHNTSNKISVDDTFNKINELITKNIHDYINSVEKPELPTLIEIPNIKKPELPLTPTLEKSQFETKLEFQQRVQIALDQRNDTIQKLQENYRDDVEVRNSAMEQSVVARQQEIDHLIATYNLRLQNNKVDIAQEKLKQTGYAFAQVMGSPYLDNFSYDAENSMLYGDIKMSLSKYTQKIRLEMPRQVAKEVYKKTKDIGVELTYNMLDTGTVSLIDVQLQYQGSSYVATLTEKSFKVDEIQVAINTTNLVLDEKQMQAIDYTTDTLAHLQNPNLVDQYQISAVTYVNNQERSVGQAAFNDDIPTLLKKTKAREVDDKRWLIVIGIEDYQQTDNIKFAKRSAELFVQVAQKKLGISQRNTYALIDDKATAASIKGQLKLMLKNVNKGDEIFFYYNGHGIPDTQNNNEPYMLASDEIPDFVTEDSFFKLKRVYKLLTDSQASQTVAFVDSCFSGSTDGISVIKGVAASRLVPKQVSFDKSKMVVLTAGTKTQYSNMFMEKGNRLFSYYLMKAILADETDINQLYKDVRSKVRKESYKMGDLKIQEPSIAGNKALTI